MEDLSMRAVDNQVLTSTGNNTITVPNYNYFSSAGISSMEQTYEVTSNNAEKIAFVEKLIRTRKITLQEGLLLLKETLRVVTNKVDMPATQQSQYPPYVPSGPTSPWPIYQHGSSVEGHGLASTLTSYRDEAQAEVRRASGREYIMGVDPYREGEVSQSMQVGIAME